MKKQTGIKILAIIMCLFVIVSYSFMYLDNMSSVYAVTESDLQDAKDKADKLKKKQEELKKDMEKLKSEYQNTDDYLRKLDDRLVAFEKELSELNLRIGELSDEIKKAEEELKEAEAEAASQYESMKLRIQFMYEQGSESYLELLLSAESMGDMLNKAEYISKISSYDRKMLTEYQNTVTFIADTKSKLESDYTELEDKKIDVEANKATFTALQEEKKKEMQRMSATLADMNAMNGQLEGQINDADIDIKTIEEQLKREEESGEQSSAGEGTFYWPTKSRNVTSEFGPRWGRNHNGIDIGAVTPGVWGDPIYAAESGTVITSGWSNSAGNWIRISHGNGIISVYMHCSQRLVSVGDRVERGQKIATMGDTGNSQGVHLHFEVRTGGTAYTAVNPRKYITQ
ncbi:MAG: murein hydrolase activator EnvC family protein [Lachnospira sp.]